MNLASSFVNGFVNAAFGQDKLLTDDGNKWLYKNKDHGKRSQAPHQSCFRFPVHVYYCAASKDDVNVHRHAKRRGLPGNDPAVGCGRWFDSD